MWASLSSLLEQQTLAEVVSRRYDAEWGQSEIFKGKLNVECKLLNAKLAVTLVSHPVELFLKQWMHTKSKNRERL